MTITFEDAEELAIAQRLKDDLKHYAEKCLVIRSKNGSLAPFIFNKAQDYLHAIVEEQLSKTGKVRVIILKGRQQGISTYAGGRFYHKTTHRFGVKTFILTHQADSTDMLFEMVDRFNDNCPEEVKPHIGASNAKELKFDLLDSSYNVGTAGNKSVGRGFTIQLFHGSEVAFWANADSLIAGIMQAIPDEPGTEVFLESTANGTGNYFHKMWQAAQRGESEYIAVFIPWFWEPAYRKPVPQKFELDEEEIILKESFGLDNAQLAWRRSKIIELSAGGRDGKKLFKQEYPCTPDEAFQESDENAFIPSDIVLRARKKVVTDDFGALVIGVDPGEKRDATAIIRRRGRKAYGLERHYGKDPMQVTGLLVDIIKKENPDKIFIDAIGLGSGVVARLKELGYGNLIMAVNSASSSHSELYKNKRAEMWGNLKEWLEEGECQIPDDDILQTDLCKVGYKLTSRGQILLQSKDDMRDKGISSPDSADALAFTFAFPVVQQKKQLLKENYSTVSRRRGGYSWASR